MAKLNTVIDLTGVDVDRLTVENFREMTKAAGLNPHPSTGEPRGYRIRILKEDAAGIDGTTVRRKLQDLVDVQTYLNGGATSPEDIALRSGMDNATVQDYMAILAKRKEPVVLPPLSGKTLEQARQERLDAIVAAFRENAAAVSTE